MCGLTGKRQGIRKSKSSGDRDIGGKYGINTIVDLLAIELYI